MVLPKTESTITNLQCALYLSFSFSRTRVFDWTVPPAIRGRGRKETIHVATASYDFAAPAVALAGY